MRNLAKIFVLMMAMVGAGPTSVFADGLVSDISEHEIELHYSFTSRDLLLFGAIDHTGPDHNTADFDVVVVVKGPPRPIVVRKKERVAGVWLNKDAYTFENIPGYYAIAYSRPLEEVANEETLKALGLGFDYIGALPKGDDIDIVNESDAAGSIEREAFRAGLLRNKEQLGLYLDVSERMQIMSNTLFRSEFHFPSNVPVGEYEARIYLFQNGQLIADQDSPLSINKRGFAQSVYTLAHEHSAIYGIVAILLALAAGWFAGVVSRR